MKIEGGRDAVLHGDGTLQTRIREWLVSAILAGKLEGGTRIPSSRAMAQLLNVSRNTVSLAYQALAADGYIAPRPKSGYFVCSNRLAGVQTRMEVPDQSRREVSFKTKFNLRTRDQFTMWKPREWRSMPFPFVYGVVDEALFPLAAWRDCTRRALSKKYFDAWTDDHYAFDDPFLIEQVCQKILIRRGIVAGRNEVLITLGAQNAIYLLSRLLVNDGVQVAVENPGYHDARNIFRACGGSIVPTPVDSNGIVVDALGDASLAFVTPSHQFPTNITMSLRRRRELLGWAESRDALVIEDDYEFETNFTGHETPALKAFDTSSRVLYVGSLSKSLMPGLRLGYIVASPEIIDELRILRRLALRHPPGNNQRTVALFLALGHHDAQLARMHQIYLDRWNVLAEALERSFPGWATRSTFGGSSFWLEGPKWLDAERLATHALELGVVITRSRIYFDEADGPRNFFRLGFSSIPKERIPEGVRRLALTIEQVRAESRA